MEKLEEFKLFLYEHRLAITCILIGLIILVGGVYFYFGFSGFEKVSGNIIQGDIDISLKEESISKDDSCLVMVDIKGEVKTPGIYQVTCDSRVQDVISLAGGITWKADTSVLNLSKKVVDEMVIIVYSKDQVAKFGITKEQESIKEEMCVSFVEVRNDACIEGSVEEIEAIGDTPVNNTISLNKATKDELMTLPGIGASKAEDIINYRKENGNFKKIEDLKNVKGIGDSIFEKLKANISV